ncbi:MAG: hypothetical protein J0H42_04990 [Rhizobiales bacterium]|nr:hypothetical protein [Hyphomicrobiales bacterium]
MDQQTKIGIGAAAGIALMALLEPHFFESHLVLTILIYVLLICLTVWGFWPAGVAAIRIERGKLKRMWPQYLMVVSGVLFFMGLVGFLQINVRPPKLHGSSEAASSPPNRQENESRSTGQIETGRLVSQAQFAKVSELESFLGGKDENGLRQAFDIPNILQKNINTQLVRIGFIKAGKERQFIYSNYSDNGSVIVWAKEGHFSVGPSGVHIDAGPKDVLFLVTTSRFQEAQAKIVAFLNSALVPDSVKQPLSAFNDVVNKIPELMMTILDSRMHQDENFFIYNMEMGTQFYGVIVSEFATRTPHLKPAADIVLTAISASWNISK